MSGVAIARAMLVDDSELKKRVVTIMAGNLPINTQLPAIFIRQISGQEFQLLNRNVTQLVTERIQVTVLATTYLEQKGIIGMIRAAMKPIRGDVNGFYVDSIRPDIDGPDLYTESPITFEQSIDYMIRFNR